MTTEQPKDEREHFPQPTPKPREGIVDQRMQPPGSRVTTPKRGRTHRDVAGGLGTGGRRWRVVALLGVFVIVGGLLVVFAPRLRSLFPGARDSEIRALVEEVRPRLTRGGATGRARPTIRDKIAIWNLETDEPYEDSDDAILKSRLAGNAEEVGTLICITSIRREATDIKYNNGRVGYQLFATVYVVQCPEKTVAGPFEVEGERPAMFAITKVGEEIEGDLNKPLANWIFDDNWTFHAMALEAGALPKKATEQPRRIPVIQGKVAVWDMEADAPFDLGYKLPATIQAKSDQECGTLVCITKVQRVAVTKYDDGTPGYQQVATVYLVSRPENTVSGPFTVRGELPPVIAFNSGETVSGDLQGPLAEWITSPK